jgi:predicted amidohydrolase YtcJ
MVAEIEAAGKQAAIHAIGDRAVEQAQNAIETALNGRSNDNRHRIEHNSVIRPELLHRYGEIGIVPAVFALYTICNPFGPEPPEEYRTWEWPWPALIEANPGLPVAWHGDDPWIGQVRPLDDLYGFVTRNDIAEDGTVCTAPEWQKQHTISVEQALQMMTINAAYALFREDAVGSLEVGKYADLIVLSQNPMGVDVEMIRETAVWLTMVGGQTAYCASEHENLCP